MAAVADGMINIDLPGIDGANEDLFMTELFGGGDSSELQPNPSHNLFTQAPSQQQPQRLPSVEESILNRLLSAVYSGPTLGDIENALSVSTRKGDAAAAKDQFASSRPSFFSRGLSFGCSRMQDNKYTVRIKSSGATGGGMADDGYKWRKYGQKSIKNSPYPRSYYRCTNPRCNAKKQVERSADDPAVYVVTYEGLHLHYAYPQFFVPKLTARSTAGPTTDDLPAQKRPKIVDEEPPALRPAQRPIHGISKTQASLTTAQPDLTAASLSWKRQTGEEEKDRPSLAVEANRQQNQQQLGLLEDIVPLLVRNPVSTSTSTSTGYHSENQLLSSHPSPPRSPHLISSPTSSSSTSSSLTWSPTPTTAPSSYFDMVRMLSSAVPSNSTLNYPCN